MKIDSILTALASLVISTGPAAAAPSDLDIDFGTAGRIVFEKSSGQETWSHVESMPGGDILIAGKTATNAGITTGIYLIRLNKSGVPVTSFGNNGELSLSVVASALKALPNGKILAAGFEFYTLNNVQRVKITVLRLLSNGTPDITFGGDGTVEVDTLRSTCSGINGMALDPEGEIVIMGSAGVANGLTMTFIRLTSDGFLDPTFSGDGIVNRSVAPWTLPSALAIQPDGKLVVAGYASPTIGDISSDLMIARLLTNGDWDPSFANGGKLLLDVHGAADKALAVCLRPSGNIVAAGSTVHGSTENSLFVSLKQNGTLDESFGSSGIVEIDAAGGNFDRTTGLLLMPDGRAIASATFADPTAGTRFAAIRLMPDGTQDSTFGIGGVAQITGTEDSVSNSTYDIDRTPSGGILIIGHTENLIGQGGMLVKLIGDPDSDGDGVVDASESNTGVYLSPFNTGTDPNIGDSDGDSLSDGDEAYQYLTNPLLPDTDGDGFLDGYEVQTGKSPTDPLDKPALVAEARTAIEFTFPSAIGKTYNIEGSPDMTTWASVEDGIAGTGTVITRFYTTRNLPKGFLRVEQQSQP